MAVTIVIVYLIGKSILLGVKEIKNPIITSISIFFGLGAFLLVACGIIGMMAKTFHWMGNSW